MVKAIAADAVGTVYDGAAWDLNTPSGIIDLRTGAVRPHDRESLCTKITITDVSYDNDENYTEWCNFINHVSNNDQDFARYLQTLAGMAAVGEVYEEGLVISYGPGGNGKSTLFGALRTVLGSYARVISADVLVSNGHSNVDQSFVAALRGARLVIMGETE